MKNLNALTVAPSVLAADFSSLGLALDKIADSGADWVHWDLMDGHFVPNLSFGPPLIAALRARSKLFFDVHLMVTNPGEIALEAVKAGANAVTFHWEAEVHHHRLIERLHGEGVQAGIAVVPSTPVELLQDVLPFLDIILVMTVNPGFGGQSYLPFCEKKIEKLFLWRESLGLNYRISVDGGIQEKTAIQARKAGADTLVTGSAFFHAENPAEFVGKLRGGTLT